MTLCRKCIAKPSVSCWPLTASRCAPRMPFIWLLRACQVRLPS
jgi:hypothetical protein